MLLLIPPVRSNSAESNSKITLSNVLKNPEYLPQLKERLTEDMTNEWNEFISNHDPLERPELFKTNADFFEFQCIFLIVLVSTFKECTKSFRYSKRNVMDTLKYISNTFEKECKKRQVNVQTFVKSIFVTLHPITVLRTITKKSWYWVTYVLSIPFQIYMEFKAFQSCYTLSYCAYPDTIFGFLHSYVPEKLHHCNKNLKEIKEFFVQISIYLHIFRAIQNNCKSMRYGTDN